MSNITECLYYMKSFSKRLSFTSRSFKAKKQKDYLANYAIVSQSKNCGYPKKFVESLNHISQLDNNFLPYRDYCCDHQYLSPHNDFSFYNSISSKPLFTTKIDTKSKKGKGVLIDELLDNGLFDPHFYQVSNPDLPHMDTKDLFNHFLKK